MRGLICRFPRGSHALRRPSPLSSSILLLRQSGCRSCCLPRRCGASRRERMVLQEQVNTSPLSPLSPFPPFPTSTSPSSHVSSLPLPPPPTPPHPQSQPRPVLICAHSNANWHRFRSHHHDPSSCLSHLSAVQSNLSTILRFSMRGGRESHLRPADARACRSTRRFESEQGTGRLSVPEAQQEARARRGGAHRR